MLSLTLAAPQSYPTTSAGLYSYLCGRWRVSKTLKYVRGGRDGSFCGMATFEPLQCDDGRARLRYGEEGVLSLDGEAKGLSASRRLLYDFEPLPRALQEQTPPDNDMRLVHVLFDESGARGAAEVREAARFFHAIRLSAAPDQAPAPFTHPCGPDMYTGRFVVRSEDEFVLDWRVDGPRKLGSVMIRYRRHQSSAQASALGAICE